MKKKLGLGCLTLILIGIFAASVFAYRQHRYFDRVVAEAQAMGLPTSVAELEAMYPMPPDEENAAVRYREAFKQRAAIEMLQSPEERVAYRTLHIVGEADPPPGAVWSAEYLALAKAYAAGHADVLETLHEAAAMPGCRFRESLDLTAMANDRDYLTEMRDLARIAAFSADVAARSGRHDDAVRTIETLAAMHRHFGSQPLLIDAMVANAFASLTLNAAEQIIPDGGFTGPQLAAMEEALASMDDPGAVARAISSEMANMLSFTRGAQTPLSGGQWTLAEEFPRTARFLSWLASPIVKGMTAGLVEWEIQFISAAKKPMPASLDALDAVVNALAGATAGNPLARMTMPNLTRSYQSYAEVAGRIRVVAALCAVERYRIAEGNPPATLDALVPAYLDAVPIDSFDGKSLRYSPRSDGGYLLYSIGFNRLDDKGGGDDIAIDTGTAQ